jgi:hypothetical protein
MPARSFRAPLLTILLVLVAVSLGACGGSVAPPAASVGSPSPSSTVAPSTEPSSEPSPEGSSSGADPDAGAALDAFRAFIQTDQSFHMNADMQVTVGGRLIDMDMAGDVAPPNERADIIIRASGASVAMEIVLVDGVAYAQLANRPWQILPTETSSANPLLALDIEGLEPMGTVNVAGQRTHHFRVSDPSLVDPSLISASSITDVEISTLSYDIYVTDNGEPLAAIMEFSGSGVAEGELQDLNARIRYDFSKFGEPIVIEKPVVPASPSAGP